MFLVLLIFIGLAIGNPIVGSDGVERRTMIQIYHAALKEKGPLRVAMGGDTRETPDALIKEFNKEYPGVVLDVKVDASKYLDSAIDRTYQVTGGKYNGADVAILHSIQDFPRWRDEGRLMVYKVIPFDDIYPEFVDPDGAYTGCFIHKSTLPTTYADFLKPEWAEKLILTYPNDNDEVLYLFKLITEKYGFEFVDTLIKTQKARWVRGTATASLMIAQSGTNNTDNRSVSFSGNSPTPDVASVAPEDTYMAWTKISAIFATTQVPESAKLFMNFLLGDTWQALESEGKFSVRKAYDGSGIFKQKFVEPLGYLKFMADRAEVERWRLQFESFLGPPQGPDPVTIW